MNPTMQSRLTPEIMEALMRRRAGGMGGGNTMPAQGQVMNPTPMGGPIGPSQTPFQMSPQAVPAGNIPQSSGSSGPAPSSTGGQSQPGAGSSGGSDPNKALMKALLQRLIADMPG